MKLLFCKNCQDLIRLIASNRSCLCGKTSGHYDDDLNAVYEGDFAVPIGFLNSSFSKAIQNQPQDGKGEIFKAFVIPKDCPTFKKFSPG